MEGSLTISVGGIGIRLEASDPMLKIGLDSETAKFASTDGRCDVLVKVRTGSLSEDEPGEKIFEAGSVWSLYRRSSDLVFRFWSPRWGRRPYKEAVFDPSFTAGTVTLNAETRSLSVPVDPLEFPLNELMLIHTLAVRGQSALLHACGVVDNDGRGYLFSGNSGNGKTTTARLWNQVPGARILNDDRLVVRQKGRDFFMYGTPWHGQGEFCLAESALIHKILFIEHGRTNELLPVPRSEAIAALVARSFLPFHCSQGLASSVAFYDALTSGVETYRFRFVPDKSAVQYVQSHNCWPRDSRHLQRAIPYSVARDYDGSSTTREKEGAL